MNGQDIPIIIDYSPKRGSGLGANFREFSLKIRGNVNVNDSYIIVDADAPIYIIAKFGKGGWYKAQLITADKNETVNEKYISYSNLMQ